MTGFHHFEFPPPRSWEQFEELCADLFEALWNDPGLVRHGRAGQRQHGVDIVARQGGVFPVGLQCKKKSSWPVKKVTKAEIDAEVEEAKGFTPALEAFYLLTTAEDDTKLQAHVRAINVKHEKAGIFKVVLLAWPEIMRRIARVEHVARKHFAGFGAAAHLSPLLGTWYVNQGQIEMTETEWVQSVSEAVEDFYDWPNGHIVVRQRETDSLIEEIQKLLGQPVTANVRQERTKLRKELRKNLSKEREVEFIIKLILTYEKFRVYFLEVWEEDGDLPKTIQSLIESRLNRKINSAHEYKIRVHPPSPTRLQGVRTEYSVAANDIAIDMPWEVYEKINEIKKKRREMYGRPLTETVSELPVPARAQYVVPQIILRILRIQQEEKKTLDEMDAAGYLDLGLWKVTY